MASTCLVGLHYVVPPWCCTGESKTLGCGLGQEADKGRREAEKACVRQRRREVWVLPEGIQHKPLAIDDLVVLQQLAILGGCPVEHVCAGVVHVLHHKIICYLGHLLAVEQLLLLLTALLLLQQVAAPGASECRLRSGNTAAGLCRGGVAVQIVRTEGPAAYMHSRQTHMRLSGWD